MPSPIPFAPPVTMMTFSLSPKFIWKFRDYGCRPYRIIFSSALMEWKLPIKSVTMPILLRIDLQLNILANPSQTWAFGSKALITVSKYTLKSNGFPTLPFAFGNDSWRSLQYTFWCKANFWYQFAKYHIPRTNSGLAIWSNTNFCSEQLYKADSLIELFGDKSEYRR